MAPIIDIRRTGAESRWLMTAQVMNARLRNGVAKTGNMKPIIAVAIDLWSKNAVTINDAIMRRGGIHRSDFGAWLKNTHQMMTANQHNNPPIMPNGINSGATIGMKYHPSHWSDTAIMPGKRRSG